MFETGTIQALRILSGSALAPTALQASIAASAQSLADSVMDISSSLIVIGVAGMPMAPVAVISVSPSDAS
jgi:hypothetical protein